MGGPRVRRKTKQPGYICKTTGIYTHVHMYIYTCKMASSPDAKRRRPSPVCLSEPCSSGSCRPASSLHTRSPQPYRQDRRSVIISSARYWAQLAVQQRFCRAFNHAPQNFFSSCEVRPGFTHSSTEKQRTRDRRRVIY